MLAVAEAAERRLLRHLAHSKLVPMRLHPRVRAGQRVLVRRDIAGRPALDDVGHANQRA
jgi:hypothetical protein